MKLSIFAFFKSKLYQTALILFIISSVFSIKLSNDIQIKFNLQEKIFPIENSSKKNETTKILGNIFPKLSKAQKELDNSAKPKAVIMNRHNKKFFYKSLKDDLIKNYFKGENKIDYMRFKQRKFVKDAYGKAFNIDDFNIFKKKEFEIDGHYIKIDLLNLSQDDKEILNKSNPIENTTKL